jgi:putative transposase
MDVEESRHHHRPCHLFVPEATYFVTAATHHKQHFFRSDEAKDIVLTRLLEVTNTYGWRLQAWAVLVNHYHFVAVAPEDAKSLKPMLQELHSRTAIEINRLEATSGRRIWYQYRDTCITNERSHLARLRYVHSNPERHGVVGDATRYRWCSMAWMMRQNDELVRRILSAPMDRLRVYDDFD